MTNLKLIQKTRRSNARRYYRKSLDEVTALVNEMDDALDNVQKCVQHAKEMEMECQEFPSMANRLCADMSRENVLHILNAVNDQLGSSYDNKLGRGAKHILPFQVFIWMFQERLFNIDMGGK